MSEHCDCLTCQFWDESTRCPDDYKIPANQRKRAACRRYPQIAWRASNEWCGEHKYFTGPARPSGTEG